MYVVFGMPERDADDPSVLYNAAAVIGPEGILGTYRKLHLGTLPLVTEGITYRPGSSLPLFATRFGPIGVMIDYDFSFNPELSRLLMLKGARVLVNPSATTEGPGKRDYFVGTAAARAQENLVYTASANLIGAVERTEYSAGHLSNPRGDDYLGHSVIAGPAFPRYSQVFVEAGDIGSDRERDAQLRQAPSLGFRVPDPPMACGPSTRSIETHRRGVRGAGEGTCDYVGLTGRVVQAESSPNTRSSADQRPGPRALAREAGST